MLPYFFRHYDLSSIATSSATTGPPTGPGICSRRTAGWSSGSFRSPARRSSRRRPRTTTGAGNRAAASPTGSSSSMSTNTSTSGPPGASSGVREERRIDPAAGGLQHGGRPLAIVAEAAMEDRAVRDARSDLGQAPGVRSPTGSETSILMRGGIRPNRAAKSCFHSRSGRGCCTTNISAPITSCAGMRS